MANTGITKYKLAINGIEKLTTSEFTYFMAYKDGVIATAISAGMDWMITTATFYDDDMEVTTKTADIAIFPKE